MKSDLINLFNAVYSIKNQNNKEFYDLCENEDLVKYCIEQISSGVKINKNNIRKTIDINNIDVFSVNYTHIPYPPIKLSLERIKIVIETIKKLKISLGFDFETIECLVLLFMLHLNVYIDAKLNKTDNDELKPFLNLSYINSSLNKNVEQFLNIVSNDLDNYSSLKQNMIVKDKDDYLLFYPNAFAYDLFRVLERYIISILNDKEKEDYYNVRGREFENYVFTKLQSFFPGEKFYRNYYYLNNNKKYEIDLIIDLGEYYLIIETKSSKFLDDNERKDERQVLKELKNSIGKGYITVNNARQYLEANKEIVLQKEGHSSINLASKPILGNIITLSSMKFVTGQIQKLDLKKIEYLPLSLSIMDFETIMCNAGNKENFIKYAQKRIEIVNKYKQLTCDIDEVDVYGYIANNEFDKFEKMFFNNNVNFKGDVILSISNAVYRKQANQEIDEWYMDNLIKKHVKLTPTKSDKFRRNDKCPCGSGKKFKHCCLK